MELIGIVFKERVLLINLIKAKNKMKNKLLILLVIFTAFTLHAQIAIGKIDVQGGAILDFDSGTEKGILLPIVETLPGNAVDGTLLMDKNDSKLKMKVDGTWRDLSDAGSVSTVNFNNSDEKGKGIIIGDQGSTAEGVLVLEASDKALVLPKVNAPHLNVKSPHPGMICYDTLNKMLAVFDGLKWNYWK